MNGNIFKLKSNKSRTALRKINYKYIQSPTSNKNIIMKPNFNFTNIGINSPQLINNNGLNKAQSQNKIIFLRKRKGDEIHKINYMNPPIQKIPLDRVYKSNSDYNIFSNQNINFTANKGKNSKVIRYNQEPKTAQKQINTKNIFKNSIYKNTNFKTYNNHFNNNLLNQQNQEAANNSNLMPEKNNILEYTIATPRDRINFNSSQNTIDKERFTIFQNSKKFSLLNSINEQIENSKENFGINQNYFTTVNHEDNIQPKNLNFDELNENNYINKKFNDNNNTINYNGQFNHAISPSLESIINQLNKTFQNGDGIDNKLMNNYSNMNSQPINFRQTILPLNNNDSYNNILNNIENKNSTSTNQFDEMNNQIINQSNNADLFQSIPSLNQNGYNNQANPFQSQNNYTGPYSQYFNNYNQKKENNNGKILLRDFGSFTRAGCEEDGLPKTNQDSFFSKTNINGINDFNIFGVLDGHGPLGHLISEFAADFIPNQLTNNLEIRLDKNTESIYNKLKANNYELIKEAFISTDTGLESYNIDADVSGTTCILIIHIGNHLISANVGDSRAIVVFDEENDPNLNFLKVIPLSIDSKPESPDEKERILSSGGVVEKIKKFGEGVGPFRVFARGKSFPGLAMSRSIGDFSAKKLGVIAEPGIIEYYIGNNTKFFVLCSDGVWEFLSNDLVKNVGKQYYLNSNANELCQELISRSVIEWKTHETTIDDITAVAGFF